MDDDDDAIIDGDDLVTSLSSSRLLPRPGSLSAVASRDEHILRSAMG